MKYKKYGFGLVGCGLISGFHAKAIKHSERMELISVTDLDKERSKKISSEFDCDIQDFEKMILDPRIDVINVLTPNAMHYDIVIKAAKAKKHILVEKPPEMTIDKVDKMINACAENKVKAGVVLQCRFRKAVEEVKNALDSSRFGKILYASASMKWFRAQDYYYSDNWRRMKEQGAGVTIQQAFHYIDLLLYLAGDVAKVFSKMKNISHPGIDLEDTVQSFIEYKNGAVGSLEASTACYPGIDVRLEICGENGLAIIRGEKVDEWKFREEKAGDDEIRKIGSTSGPTGASGAAALQFGEHLCLFEDFIDAIEQDKQPRITLEQGKRTLQLAMAMYKSDEEKKWINI